MDVDQAKNALFAAGMKIKSEERLANETGTQIRLVNGAIVNVFDNENFNVQGKKKAEVEGVLRRIDSGATSGVAVAVIAEERKKRKVFRRLQILCTIHSL